MKSEEIKGKINISISISEIVLMLFIILLLIGGSICGGVIYSMIRQNSELKEQNKALTDAGSQTKLLMEKLQKIVQDKNEKNKIPKIAMVFLESLSESLMPIIEKTLKIEEANQSKKPYLYSMYGNLKEFTRIIKANNQAYQSGKKLKKR